jgi:hypothetical protein
MKTYFAIKTLLALILVAFLVGLVLTAFSATSVEASTPQYCPGGTLRGSLPQPPPGMASHQVVTLDANCNPVWGQIEFVPRTQMFHVPNANTKGGTFNLLRESLLGKLSPNTSSPQIATDVSKSIHAENQMWDCCGILMNQLYTDASWTYNGSVVTSYSVGGGYSRHTENSPPSCGTGWYVVNPYNVKTSGGIGQPSASFKQHAEFGYKGIFDCGGSQFYNILDNYETLSAGYVCNQYLSYRNWFAGWNWQHWCG